MQAETAIDSWREWSVDLRSRPVITGPLGGGRSNRSFLLNADGVKIALRLNSKDRLLPEIGRSQEAAVWRAASSAGIAPPLLYVDDQETFLVSAFVDNRLPSEPTQSELVLNHAFDLLERCHGLTVDTQAIDYTAHIEQYWKKIDARKQSPPPALDDMRKSMGTVVKELQNSVTQIGLCHHDPVVANFVGTPERLYLIDWEYAANGFIVMDYAALAVEWCIDDAMIVERTSLVPEALKLAKRLYNYLCALWGHLGATSDRRHWVATKAPDLFSNR